MGKLYPRLAWQNIRRDRKFYIPYLLTLMGTTAALYIATALSMAQGLPNMNRYFYLTMFMTIGVGVLTLFSVIFLTYTNSFLAKRRQRELGLYNILGMGKRHIAGVLGMETIYLALMGLAGGIGLGILLHAVLSWALCATMGIPAYFEITPCIPAMVSTALTIGGILLFNLLLNLRRVHAQKPVELLRQSAVGETEPKTRWLVAVLGVLTLGGGYAIAVLTKSAVDAVVYYFLAVFLVIIGTYCLFTALSIVILKALRKNTHYYYQTTHFIGVSGMLHRMKRNAVGLANICILCTMVLVMISGTLALYQGSQQNLMTAFPGEVTMTTFYDPLTTTPDKEGLKDIFIRETFDRGYAPKLVGEAEYFDCRVYLLEDGTFSVEKPENPFAAAFFTVMTPEMYQKLTGKEVPWDGLGHLYKTGDVPTDSLIFHTGEGEYRISLGAPLTTAPRLTTAFAYVSDFDYTLVLPQKELMAFVSACSEAASRSFTWRSFWDIGGDVNTQQSALYEVQDVILESGQRDDWISLSLQSRADYGEEYYALNGGFFFLGVFLGVIFIMAAALILYYKQISEGYEDQARFQIMRNVGLSEGDIRRSVNAQTRVLFFAPLLVAGVHIAFDFPLVRLLLGLFGVYDAFMIFLCTVGVFAAFTVLYWAIYKLTARAYLHIVR